MPERSINTGYGHCLDFIAQWLSFYGLAVPRAAATMPLTPHSSLIRAPSDQETGW